MFNFTDVVSDILTEQPVPGISVPDPAAEQTLPDWLQSIVKKHTELFADVPVNKIDNLFLIANKRPRPSSEEIRNNIEAVRIIDIIRRLINTMPDPKPKTYAEFLDKLKLPNTEKEGKNINNNAQKLDANTKYNWEIQDTDIHNQYNIARAESDKAGAVSLATYNGLSILEATIQIVKKRTDIWNRIAKLKSPIQPFVNLITQIFTYPEQFMSGQRKVSGDFYEIVDNLYPESLFKVGLAAKEFFAAEIGRLKLDTTDQQPPQTAQQTQTTQQPTTGPVPDSRLPSSYANVPITQGLNLFDKFIDSVLIKEKGIIPTIQQGARYIGRKLRQRERQYLDPKFRQRYESIKNKLKQDTANYLKFIKNEQIEFKKIDTDGKETDTDKAPRVYTIGQITKMETTEAINLITALRNISEYTRKRLGAGQALSKTAGALGALRTSMGPVG